MASLVFDSFLEDLANGDIAFDSDTFHLALTNGYTPAKGTHSKLADVTNQTTGTGYTAGGNQTNPSVTKDGVNHRLDISFSTVTWPNATLTANGGVIYKNGGSAGDKRLVAFVDFGQDVSSTNAAFAVTFSSPLRFQN